MLPAIEKLIILQERDRKIVRLQAELASLPPQRTALQARADAASSALDSARHRAQHLESERKELELEVEARKGRIERYSLQQFQTKRNEEYRALAHEIELCKAEITKLDDRQLEFMEQIETAQRQLAEATRAAQATRADMEQRIAALAEREASLTRTLDELTSDRDALAAAVDPEVLPRYDRLRRNKGETVVVGVDHSACGGCHMKLPTQVVVACRAEQELVACPNCGRLLYYTRAMDLVAAE